MNELIADVVDEDGASKRDDHSGDDISSGDKTVALREVHIAQLPLVDRLAMHFEKSTCFTRFEFKSLVIDFKIIS